MSNFIQPRTREAIFDKGNAKDDFVGSDGSYTFTIADLLANDVNAKASTFFFGDGLDAFKQAKYMADHGLYAFDLLKLDGEDLRREPFETRKATLASLLRGSRPAPERAPDPSRRRRLCARLQDGPGGHRVEAAGLALRLGADA